MDPKYLYLSLDLLAISIPLAFSFYPRANFSKKWKYLFPSILITAIFFLVWDEWFTSMGVWGFNNHYLTGIYLSSLPIEEILFFICIPYACVFTYEAVGYLSRRPYFQPMAGRISMTLIIILSAIALLNVDRWYTLITFSLLSIFLVYLTIKLRPEFMGQFYLAYLFILIPFFIINGILTGTAIETQVVWYNDSENLGIRIGTIPVEDIFYGMLLILMNVTLYETFQKRSAAAS